MVKGKKYNEMHYGAKHFALYFNGSLYTSGKLGYITKRHTNYLTAHAE